MELLFILDFFLVIFFQFLLNPPFESNVLLIGFPIYLLEHFLHTGSSDTLVLLVF